MRIAVAGSTTWGITLAWLLAKPEHRVVILARDAAEAAAVDEYRGLPRVPELSLPASITIATPETCGAVDAVIVAVPARAVRAFLQRLPGPRDMPVLTATKGIEQGTAMRMSQVLEDLGWTDVSALSGPNLAHEVVRGLPAAAVVASGRDESGLFWQEALASPVFRTYRSDDLIGVEVAGAYKNVVAIAAGASAGLDLGANTLATIMTRGLAEMTRLGVALGAQPATFSGLAGVGDLAVTCFSPLSRNHQLGELLAEGRTPDAALAEIGETVEGASTAPVVVELGRRLGIDVPIAEQVAAVVTGRSAVSAAMHALLSRSLKSEAPWPAV